MEKNLLAGIYSVLRRNRFLVALLGTLVLAFVFPAWGTQEGPLHAGTVSRLGIMVIFFLQGLTLETRELAGGLKDLRLHAFVQSWIFLLSPVFIGAAALIMFLVGSPELAKGFLYLALVPTTISSAIAFTSIAGGNVPSAIFNTTLSNVIGVFWVPTGCLLLFSIGSGVDAGQLLPLLMKLARLILLPMVMGQVLRPFVCKTSAFTRFAPHSRQVCQLIILFTVYSAFCESILSGTWSRIQPLMVFYLLVVTLLCVLMVHACAWLSSGILFTRRSDRICGLFCGSHKTLAAGIPMAVAIFSDTSPALLGIIILPLLCYHPAQLLLAGIILPRLKA